MQGFKYAFGAFVGDAVVQRLRVAAKGNQPLLAQLREMLREGRLADFDAIDQLAHRKLLGLQQVTQDEQSRAVGDRTQEVGCLPGILTHSIKFDWVCDRHAGNIFNISKLASPNLMVRDDKRPAIDLNTGATLRLAASLARALSIRSCLVVEKAREKTVDHCLSAPFARSAFLTKRSR